MIWERSEKLDEYWDSSLMMSYRKSLSGEEAVELLEQWKTDFNMNVIRFRIKDSVDNDWADILISIGYELEKGINVHQDYDEACGSIREEPIETSLVKAPVEVQLER